MQPKTKSELIRAWLKENPRGSYTDFIAAHPLSGVCRSLFAHVSNSRRTLKKLRPKYRGRRVIATKKEAAG